MCDPAPEMIESAGTVDSCTSGVLPRTGRG